MAEKGVGLPPEVIIQNAEEEIFKLMPWVDLSNAEWAALPIERAEPRQKNFTRPDKAFASSTKKHSNITVAWPTKLTLCPNLADEVIALLDAKQLQKSEAPAPNLSFLDSPDIAKTPWQTAFGD
mgnify:FL=1